MFKRRQKKLTLRQVHELYLLLKPTLPEKEKKYLLNEIDEMLEKITTETMGRVLEILEIETKDKTSLQILSIFIRRLREVGFFEYVGFLRGINGERRNS